MNSGSRIWALFRFHATVNPALWIFPLAFGGQGAIPLFFGGGGSYNNLGLAVTLGMQTMWVPLLLATFIFGPEIFATSRVVTPTTGAMGRVFDTEFLLTKAVDRTDVYWARMALYWVMLLLVAGLLFAPAAVQPGLSLTVPKDTAKWLTEVLPGGSVTTTLANGRQTVGAPMGGVFLGGWRAGVFLFAGIFAQVYLFAILPLRGRRWWYWAGFSVAIASAGAIPILAVTDARSGAVEVFLFAVRHGWAFAGGGIAFAAAALWFSRRRFLRIEFC